MFLNVGCGNKFHKEWVNVDIVSNHPEVIAYNILNGLPFPENHFDVVYHSQVLEHIPKEKAMGFVAECFRVLKPGGIIRVVLPDLENIVDEYKKTLEQCLSNNNDMAEANYDWIVLEMYDQTVRDIPGGMMAKYIEKPVLINEDYLSTRVGYIGKMIRKYYMDNKSDKQRAEEESTLKSYFEKIVRNLTYRKIRQRVLSAILTKDEREYIRLGQFRRGGEIHYWMYDRFSLARLLQSVGFSTICCKNPFESDIANWPKYELDVKDNVVYDPTALFIEARKPLIG